MALARRALAGAAGDRADHVDRARAGPGRDSSACSAPRRTSPGSRRRGRRTSRCSRWSSASAACSCSPSSSPSSSAASTPRAPPRTCWRCPWAATGSCWRSSWWRRCGGRCSSWPSLVEAFVIGLRLGLPGFSAALAAERRARRAARGGRRLPARARGRLDRHARPRLHAAARFRARDARARRRVQQDRLGGRGSPGRSCRCSSARSGQRATALAPGSSWWSR